MSEDTSVLDFTKVYAVIDATTNIVSYETTYHEPIVSAAQGPQGPAGPGSSTIISELNDVSLDTLVDGSILVYDEPNQVWVSTTTLNKQALDCGQY